MSLVQCHQFEESKINTNNINSYKVTSPYEEENMTSSIDTRHTSTTYPMKNKHTSTFITRHIACPIFQTVTLPLSLPAKSSLNHAVLCRIADRTNCKIDSA
jgi:hypothetical protein